MRYVYKVQFFSHRCEEMFGDDLWTILWQTCRGESRGEEQFVREMLALLWVTTLCGPLPEVVASWREQFARKRGISIKQLDATLLLTFPLRLLPTDRNNVRLEIVWSVDSSLEIQLWLTEEAFGTLRHESAELVAKFLEVLD